jgi:superfamily II DNA/RNA helicase
MLLSVFKCNEVFHCLCKVLVFSEKKAEVDDIHEYLLLKGVQAVSLHGGKGMVCSVHP